MMGGFYRRIGTGDGVKGAEGHRKKIVFGEAGGMWARGGNGLRSNKRRAADESIHDECQRPCRVL